MSDPINNKAEKIEKLHEEACQDGRESYIDPDTGYTVFTRLKHLARGNCCKSGCRHCPYGFKGSSGTDGPVG